MRVAFSRISGAVAGAGLCLLGFVVLGCEQSLPSSAGDEETVSISLQETGAAGKLQLEFNVMLPDPDHADGFPPNRVMSAVKERVLKEMLNDLQRGLDQFQVYAPSSGPMEPPVLIDETKTLSELGLADGTRLIIRMQ